MKGKFSKFKHSFKTHWKQFMDEGKTCIEEFKNPETRYKQIPNVFTASRLFAPFFIIPSAMSGNLPLTALFVTSFALTDAADGYFARKFNAASEFGRKLDALTDKLFAASLLIPLISFNPVLISLLTMESIISIINVNSQLNNNKPKTEYIGKVKTTALSLTILISYLSLMTHIPNFIINTFISSTIILQACSACKYYRDNLAKEELKKKETIKDNDLVQPNEDKKKELEKVIDLDAYRNSFEQLKGTILTSKEKAEELRRIREQLTYREIDEKAKVIKLEQQK